MPFSHSHKPGRLPSALTIGGSDSLGASGIQVDLRVFSALDVHGATAVTAVTAQNSDGVAEIHPVPPDQVAGQIAAVLDELVPGAVKCGMLFSAAIVRAVGRAMRRCALPLVIDPVMNSTTGCPLMRPAGRRALAEELIPIASLVTPNLDETELLLGERPDSLLSMRAAARRFYERFGVPVLIKGGHLPGSLRGSDHFFDGTTELCLRGGAFRREFRGTGCALSAAIAACLARGHGLIDAVKVARRAVVKAMDRGYVVGRASILRPRGRR